MPLKYRSLRRRSDVRFITWLRNPVERLVSHYNFWQRIYTPQSPLKVHRQVIERNWSLERFCLSPLMRNFYSRVLWGFPLRFFDFIGVTEYYETELKRFGESQGFTAPLMVLRENINQARSTVFYPLDPGLRMRIERYHAKDMRLYQRALKLRLQHL